MPTLGGVFKANPTKMAHTKFRQTFVVQPSAVNDNDALETLHHGHLSCNCTPSIFCTWATPHDPDPSVVIVSCRCHSNRGISFKAHGTRPKTMHAAYTLNPVLLRPVLVRRATQPIPRHRPPTRRGIHMPIVSRDRVAVWYHTSFGADEIVLLEYDTV